jgi:formylmethanofuran dehydrogenase subunit E
MGLYAGEILGLEVPQVDKRLLAIVETDGCAADGIAVATNCWIGRRTMRVEDYGKVAATFVDTQTERAVRLVPRPEARELARSLVPDARNKWEAQLLGYQALPAGELLSVQAVHLKTPVDKIISRAGRKALCEMCGEEILNEREIVQEGCVLCRACGGRSYYQPPDVWPRELVVRPLVVEMENAGEKPEAAIRLRFRRTAAVSPAIH